MERTLLFSSLSPVWRQTEGIRLWNCCPHSAPRSPNPYIGVRQCLLWRQLRGPAGAEQRAHEPFGKWQSRAVPWEPHPLHVLPNEVELMWSKRSCVTRIVVFLEIGHLYEAQLVHCLEQPPSLYFRDAKEQWAWTVSSHLFQSKYSSQLIHNLPDEKHTPPHTHWLICRWNKMHYYHSFMTLISLNVQNRLML